MTVEERYIRVKRALFDKVYSNLNNRQREAVYAVNGPLLVIAGAGSGKTTVLVHRIAQIIRYGNAYASDRAPAGVSGETVEALEEAALLPADEIRPILDEFTVDPCPPWNMLAITFTNKAANEMKERLAKMFDDPETPKSIWAGTFHAVCMRIIRAHAKEMGYGDGVTIYDTDDTKKAIGAVMKDRNTDEKTFPIRSVMGEISRAKEKLQTPGEYFAESRGTFREKEYAGIYEEYQKRLRTSNAMDFDDIIMQTVLFLRSNDEARSYYGRKFRYICVDEYQDTNPAQFELCRLFASEYGNLMVVGDDDQSIYRFRGATVENILGFDKAYPGARIIKLEQNYRSTRTILDAANAVIDKNALRHKKTLWTENGEGAKIVLETCADENAEARRITDIIQKAVAERRYRYRDFAVLYRVNAQSNSIERTMAKSGVPYRIYGGTRFTDRKEIRDVIAYLQLINNHSDRVRLKRIINEPRRKIGDTTIAAVEAIADENSLTMFDVMKNAGNYAALSRSARTLSDFAGMIEELTGILESGCPLDAFINQVLDRTGYRQMLIDGGAEEKDRLDNVNEFISGAIEYMKQNGDEASLTGFLEENALVADVDKYDEEADAAVLMTIHSAKGLEFPVAILPGLEEGIFPGTQSQVNPDELDEERRLAYVAITRAKKELFILHTDHRLLYGRTTHNQVSRFVEDIPPELVNEIAPKPAFDPAGEYAPWGNYGSERPRVYMAGGETPRRAPGAPAGNRAGERPAAQAPHRRIPVTSDTLTVNKPQPRINPAAAAAFAPGDRVRHNVFGGGTVLSVKPMGADMLYEIVFDTVGTKKLMATYAKLTKEST